MRSVEDAVFKSNAQFDDSDVLSKLCVKMLVTSEQENVSEAFCLQYRLDGPLNTVSRFCKTVLYLKLCTSSCNLIVFRYSSVAVSVIIVCLHSCGE